MRVIRKHDRDLPRSWFSLFVRLGGWWSLIAGLVVVVIAGVTLGFERNAALFAKDGVVTMAEIRGRRTEVTYDGDGDKQTTYFVTFAYETRFGDKHLHERSVPSGVYDEVEPGAAREIRYLDGDPERFEHTVGVNARRAMWMFWVGGAAGAFGLGTLWIFGSRANSAILARRDGEKIIGDVIAVKRLNISINDRAQSRLLFRAPDGAEGQSLMRNHSDLSVYSPGDKVTVFRRGQTMWWEGDVGPRAAEMWLPE